MVPEDGPNKPETGAEPKVESLRPSLLVFEIQFVKNTGLWLDDIEFCEDFEFFADVTLFVWIWSARRRGVFVTVLLVFMLAFFQKVSRAKRSKQAVKSWLAGESWRCGELALLRCRRCGAG